MPRVHNPEIPISKIDQLAQWLFERDCSPHYKKWNDIREESKQRMRVLDRALLTNPPGVLVQNIIANYL